MRTGRSGFSATFIEAIDGLINFVDHFFADARNFQQLLGRHSGEFLQRSDSRRLDLFDGLWSNAFQHRQRRGGRREGGHLLLDFTALLFFALDIDIPANELAGEANVLALFADGQGKLGILDNHFQLVILRDR